MSESKCKVIIVGDGAIGKTCLLSRLTNNFVDWASQPTYEPTTFNNYMLEWEDEEGEQVELELWDTAGQETFKQLRTLSYPDTDVYLIGYATNSEISLKNIYHKWLPEIQKNHTGDGDPWIILVGTKCDIRDGVTTEDAERMAVNIDASLMLETSAKTQENCDKLKAYIMSLLICKRNGNKRPTLAESSANAEYIVALDSDSLAAKGEKRQGKHELDAELHEAAKQEFDMQTKQSECQTALDKRMPIAEQDTVMNHAEEVKEKQIANNKNKESDSTDDNMKAGHEKNDDGNDNMQNKRVKKQNGQRSKLETEHEGAKDEGAKKQTASTDKQGITLPQEEQGKKPSEEPLCSFCVIN